MSISNFEEARQHVGHKIACVIYAGQNVSFECEDCNEVIIDFEKED